MNLGNMLSYLERRLRVTFFPQTSFVTTTMAIDALHDGHMEVFIKIAKQNEGFFRTTALLSETAGSPTINLPTNFYRSTSEGGLERMIDSSGASVTPHFLTQVMRNSTDIEAAAGVNWWSNPPTTGTPEGFYFNGQATITLLPTPSASLTSSLRLTYVFRPAKMVTNNHAPFQATVGAGGTGTDNLEEFHELIPLIALEQLVGDEEGMNIMPFVMQRRQELDQMLTQYLRSINDAGPRRVQFIPSSWEE